MNINSAFIISEFVYMIKENMILTCGPGHLFMWAL
jgi:hypothetical protein